MAKSHFLKPFTLIDLQRLSDDELLKDKALAGLELLQKHIAARDLASTIDKMMEQGVFLEMKHISGEYVHVMLKYIINAGELDDTEQFLEKLSSRLPEEKEVIMTIAQRLKQEGRQEGVISAARALLLSGRLSPKEIAETLNMPVAQIETLAKDGASK